MLSVPILPIVLILQTQRPDAALLADSAQGLINQARMAASPEALRQARAVIERGLMAYENDPMLNHYKGYALYVEASAANRDSVDVLPMFAEAQQALQASASRLHWPETHALLSSVMGQQITDEASAMSLGMQSAGELARARQLGPDNPRVWMIDGISAMFTPAQYGGGNEIAERKLRRAVELFEQGTNPAAPAPRWGRAESHAWLGYLLQRTGRAADARASFQRALVLEPGNVWVRDVLLPSLDRARTGG